MNSTHGKCSLYLSPELADFKLRKLSTLINALQEIRLISQAIDYEHTPAHYYTGDKFLDYIAYMGCSPAIQFEASTDSKDNNRDFCSVKILNYDSARLIHLL